MAIELTTASNNVIDSIRESLSAIGSDNIKKILDITRSNYNLLTPNPNTLYVINEGVGVNRSLLLGTSRIDFSGSIVGNLSATGLVYAAGGNSTTWNSTANIININSAKWNSNSTTVSVNSAYWIGSSTIVAANSGNWISNGGDSKGSNLTIGTNDNYNLNLETAGSTKLTVSNNGSVGINSLNPSSKLEIFDTSLANSGSLNGSGLYLAQAWNTTGSPVALKLNITNTNSGSASKLIDLRVSEASKFNVNAAGNVGIGNSQPVSKVDIYDNTTAIDLSGAALNILHVWNAPLDITAIKLNVSSSNSGANSKLLDLQIGGSSYFSVNKAGNVSTIGNASITGNLSARTFTGLDTTITGTQFNWSSGTSFFRTLTSNTTFTFTNAQPGQEIVVAISSPLSSYIITWPTVTWPGSVVPTQSTADQTDVYTFKNIGNIIYGALNRSSRVFEDAGVIYVKTWAQLQAALTVCRTNNGGTIFIDGTIIIPPHATSGFSGNGGLNITVPNLIITGHPNGKSVLRLQSGVTFTYQIASVININASNVTIENLSIEGTVTTYFFNGITKLVNSIGIHFGRGPANLGISDITIRNNKFLNTSYAIYQSGGTGSPINRNVRIVENKFTACGAGVYISYSLDNLLISENTIIGDGAVYDGTKFSTENCIWVGLGISRCRIVNNNCADHQRMGIEVFWPYRNTVTGGVVASLGQADAGIVVANNTIVNMGSMGISFAGARNSVVANNTITDTVFVGLEVVGDDRNTQDQKPDRVVNATVIGNTVKNVRATPRRKKTTAPVNTWLYGYSPIALDPTNCTLPSQSFSNRVPLSNQVPFTLGLKTFTLTTPRSYSEFAATKQALLRRSDEQYMIGTIQSNDGTTIVIDITSLSVGATGTNYTFTLCPYGLHTITVPSLNLEWSGNNFMQSNLPGEAALEGTNLLLRHPSTASANQYISATVVSYTQGATTAVISIANTGAAFDQNTSWIAMTSQMIVGLSIDQIYGCKVIGNTVDIVLDSSDSTKFGCQIQFSEDITFEGNTLARAGQRYLFVNNSNRVFIRGNTFKAGTVTMVRDAVNYNITVLGEELTTYPENIVSTNPQPWPCSLYAIFTPGAPGYNASLPYNNCRIIFKDNSVIPTPNNELKTLTNSAAIFSDQYSRPETLFGPAVVLKNNWVGEGYTGVVDWPIPVLDYSQKWSNNGQDFTGYRFHIDTNQSGASSRLFDIAAGNATYLYLRKWLSVTSNTLVIGAPNKGFAVTVVQIIGGVPTQVLDPAFALAAVPIGTFVRCTALNSSNVVQGFVEGRVMTYNPGTAAFSMLATYAEGTPGTYTNWSIQFDTSALFVDKLSKLNLRSDVVLDYHTGTKIGTAATQKLGFWNATPAAQPATVAKATDANSVIAQLNTLIDRLSSIGILAP